MKQVKHLLFAFLLITTVSIQAQVGIGTATPAASAQLDISSTTKGLLVPRMTATQKAAVSSPATGLLIYQTDGTQGFYYHNGALWNLLTIDTSSLSSRIDSKLSKTDTSSLSTRIDSKLNLTDTALLNLVSRFATKLNITDTSDMLFNYKVALDNKLNKTDTTNMLSKYLRKSDTASLSSRINSKLSASDTASLSSRIDSILSISNTAHTIGESYGGGIVFYVTTNGLHGLIAETQDQSLSAVSHTPYNAQISSTWYNAQDNISISGNHSAAGALFTDWRLPTKNELNLLYLQKVAGTVGGFANNFYWSSKEYDYSNINAAWFQNFDNGFQNAGNKDFNYCVRAIRAF